jgi:hypothetical protein
MGGKKEQLLLIKTYLVGHGTEISGHEVLTHVQLPQEFADVREGDSEGASDVYHEDGDHFYPLEVSDVRNSPSDPKSGLWVSDGAKGPEVYVSKSESVQIRQRLVVLLHCKFQMEKVYYIAITKSISV